MGVLVALERLRNVEDLARTVGAMLVGRMQSSFRIQGRGGVQWPARSVPNKAGILEDLKAGRTPPERRWESRPAGLDTGRLRSSIAFTVSGNELTIGSNVAYASDVQKGSTRTIQVDGQIRQTLAVWLRSLSGQRKKDARKAMGFLFRTGSLTISIPPRPFLILTDDDRRDIQELSRKFFGG